MKFPSSMSVLWNLQTLVRPYHECVAPPEIWEMRQLRHVKFLKIYLPDPPVSDPQDDSVVLWNLQTLETPVNLTLSDEVCKRIPNINKLEIAYHEKSPSHEYLCLWNIGRLRKLDSLYCHSDKSGIVGSDDLVKNLAFLTSLRALHLQYLSLGREDLEIIGSLPALVYFMLSGVTFSGNEWRGEFLGLKILDIVECYGLTQWSSSIDDKYDSGLPVLEKLYLCEASELDELPLGIGENTLRSIEMRYCSLSVAISAAKILEERMSLGNDEDLVVEIKFWDRAEKDVFLQEITGFECLRSNKLIISCYNNDQDAAQESETD